MYATNAVSEYQAFVGDVNDALQKVTQTDSATLFGNFNPHLGTDNKTWKAVSGKHRDPSFNDNGRYILQLCCSKRICIMHTFSNTEMPTSA